MMNNHANEMIFVWVSAILLLFALTTSFQLISAASTDIQALDISNRTTDRNVHMTLENRVLKEITGATLIAKLMNMQDESCAIDIEGIRISAASSMVNANFSFINPSKVYKLIEHRNHEGTLVVLQYD